LAESIRSPIRDVTPEDEMRFAIALATVVTSLLFGAVPTLASVTRSPAGGPLEFFATPGGGAGGTVVMTGAIGDYGKTVDVDQNGKTDANGRYEKVILQKGTLELDLSKFATAEAKAGPLENAQTCSIAYVVSAATRVFNGSGSYKGIVGTLNLTSAAGPVFPRYPDGKSKGACDMNAPQLASYSSVEGSGTVRF